MDRFSTKRTDSGDEKTNAIDFVCPGGTYDDVTFIATGGVARRVCLYAKERGKDFSSTCDENETREKAAP
jgi:hypothetical protein